MAAVILTAIAVPMSAGDRVPFKGSIEGHEIDTPQGGPPPTTLSADGNTTGIGTHVGQFSYLPLYGDPCERYRNRNCSIDRGQWRQHLYVNYRIG